MDRHARFKQGHGGGGDGYRSGEAAERARGSVVLHDDLGVVEGLSGQRKGEVSEAVVRLVPRVALLGAVVATPEAEADGGEGARGVVGEDEVGGLARVVDGFPATVIVVEGVEPGVEGVDCPLAVDDVPAVGGGVDRVNDDGLAVLVGDLYAVLRVVVGYLLCL